ncbi:MAG TPA: hypothetical protein VFX59_14140 [Polyangiales bacterium]|nr:hypothetical protein [Polyangiales bacterium]
MLFLVAMSLTGGCVFYRVPFGYTSDMHINPAARFLEVRASPAAVGKFVADYVQQNNGRIDLSELHAPVRFAPAPRGEAAFAARRRLAEQEWNAYSTNSPRRYRKADREDPLLREWEIFQIDDPAANCSWVRATMLPRTQTLSHSRGTLITPNVV